MGCAPHTSPAPELTNRQHRLLGRIREHPGATTGQLTGRFSNPAITRVDLIALIEQSLVVPVTEIRHGEHHSNNTTLGVRDSNGDRSTSTVHTTTHHTDRDAARNATMRWRTTRPGTRYRDRGTLTDIGVGTRGARLDDWWLCPRGTQMRREAITRLQRHETPLGPLEEHTAALEAAAHTLTAIVNEHTAYQMLGEPWPELSGATPTDAIATGTPAATIAAAAVARVERHRSETDAAHQRRLQESTGDEAQLITLVHRIQRRWAPQQGWCCGTVTYRSMHV